MLDFLMVMILDVNGGGMARNGPILWENDATGSRKVFKYLWGLWEAIKKSKIASKVQKCKNTVNYRIFINENIRPITPY